MTKLSYAKMILEKMSFDKRLFWKEYKKMIKWMTRDEEEVFRRWMRLRNRKNPMAPE